MKHFKLIFTILSLSAMTLVMTNCSNNSKSGDQTEKTVDKTGPEYTSAYVCPMHCKGSGGDEPGKCSVCGMDMKKNPDHETHLEETEDELIDTE